MLSLKNMKANYRIKRTFIRISRSPLPAGFFLPKAGAGVHFTGEKIKKNKKRVFYIKAQKQRLFSSF